MEISVLLLLLLLLLLSLLLLLVVLVAFMEFIHINEVVMWFTNKIVVGVN